jgi:NADH:ubiquinone oxidoreductase subunit C
MARSLITFKRNNIEKIRSVTNKLDANNPNNVAVWTKNYTERNAYDNFGILNNRRPEKVNYAIVVYVAGL